MDRALLLLLGLCLSAFPLLAHKGKKHASSERPAAEESARAAESAQLKLDRVNALYVEDVKPIFRKKCFDCHATAARLPWYSKIPGPKQLIQRDMREAKKHMDMRSDFPFAGHGTPLEDFDALEQILKDGSMPPLRYRIMHQGSALSAEEKEAILNWINASRFLLTVPGEEKRKD